MKRKLRLKLYRIQLITNNKYFIIQHSSESEKEEGKRPKVIYLVVGSEQETRFWEGFHHHQTMTPRNFDERKRIKRE